MADYEVRIADDAELVELHETMLTWLDPVVQCHPKFSHPTLDRWRGAHRVYAAYLDGEPVTAMSVTMRGQGLWLNGTVQHIARACVSLAERINRDYGRCYGEVKSPTLRAAIVALSGGRIEEDGNRLSWVGNSGN